MIFTCAAIHPEHPVSCTRTLGHAIPHKATYTDAAGEVVSVWWVVRSGMGLS